MFNSILRLKSSPVLTLCMCTLLFAGCGENPDPNPDDPGEFGDAELVEIIGYPSGSYENVQEPFVSRDGQYLLFNSGQSENNKDLLFAAWDSSENAFVYQGEVQGVNTAGAVEGNPSMDLSGMNNLTGLPTIQLSGTTASVNMGVEVSADGDTLYFSRAVFLNAGSVNQTISESDILFAEKSGDDFVFDETTANSIMQNINTEDNLEYAAGISEDGLEFFFTRTTKDSITSATPDSQIM